MTYEHENISEQIGSGGGNVISMGGGRIVLIAGSFQI
jgi:hypothetical protein